MNMLPGSRPSFISTLLLTSCSFVIGLFCSSFFDFRLSTHLPGSHFTNAPLSSLSNERLSTQPGLAPTFIGPVQEPLGLSWYKQGFRNPWSFSTLRTGVDQLHEAYQKVIDRDGALPRVVVSFTSLPRRFAVHARKMVTILKQQTYLPDAIYIAVPKSSRRSNETFSIPQWMTADPLITVLRPRRDFGPATKLIPAIEEELRLGNKKTRIITVDDDDEGRWGSSSLLSLYAYSLYFEDAAIGLTGWNVTCMVSDAHCSPEESGVPQRQYEDRMYNFIRAADDYACHSLFDWLPEYFANCMGAVRKNYVAYTDVLEGFKGTVYQPRFFNMEKLTTILDKKTPEWFLLVDDVWFSGWLGVRGVTRFVVNPAIHSNAPIAMALKAASDERNISRKTIQMDREERTGASRETEEGLHALGQNFIKANHEGVRWFEKFGAWTEDLWKRPQGFKYPKYPSEAGREVEAVQRIVLD